MTVLANLTVLLGPRLCSNAKVCRVMTGLLSLSMRHKKSSVRGLGCLVWRCVAWVWFQPPFSKDCDQDDEMEVVDEDGEKKQSVRDMYWRVVRSVVDIGAGMATIAGLLSDYSSLNTDDDAEEGNLRRVMQVMRSMIKKGGQTCGEAMDVLKILVSSDPSPSFSSSEWNYNRLLPPSLFNALPGLLSAEYKSLVSIVKPIFDQCPQLEDVRPLTREELAQDWVFEELVDIWRRGLCYLELPEECGTPMEVVAVWEGLLTARMSVLQGTRFGHFCHSDHAKYIVDSNDNVEGTGVFVVRAAYILIDILEDTSLDLTTKSGPPRNALSSSSPARALPSSHSNTVLKLSIIRDLWATVRTTVPSDLMAVAGEKVLCCLLDKEDKLMWETDSPDDARKQWAMFCAEVLLVCDMDEVRSFWDINRHAGSQRKREWSRKPETRSLVWTCFVQKWKEEREWHWEGAVILLGAPFVWVLFSWLLASSTDRSISDTDAWDFDNDDFEVWDEFLQYATNKALDYGVDSSVVLDHVATIVAQNRTPAFTDSARVADLLLTHLEVNDTRQIPGVLFDFVNDTLHSTYPPEPRNKITSIWLLRSLTRAIDACPTELALSLFDTIQDGVSLWISDSYDVFTEQEYEDEVQSTTYPGAIVSDLSEQIVPMYQTFLFGIQLLPRTVETLEAVSIIVDSAFQRCTVKSPSICEAFSHFWNFYSSLEEPASGWPDKIQACIRAVAMHANDISTIDPILLAEDVGMYDADVFMEQEDASAQDSFEGPASAEEALHFPESDNEQESHSIDGIELGTRPALSEPTSIVGQLDPAFSINTFAESQPVAVISMEDLLVPLVCDLAQAPSTPMKAHLLTSTPPRPQRSSSTPATFLNLPVRSPATPIQSSQRPTTPKRTPLLATSTVRSSPTKRRFGNKENISPQPVITSFTERLALRSHAWLMKDTVLGKRRAIGESHEESAPKKSKAESPPSIPIFGSDDGQDERLMERSLVGAEIECSSDSLISSLCLDDPFTAGPQALASTTSNRGALPMKRKRFFIDAVEVPTLREIIIREGKVTTPDKQILRRTKSARTKPSAPLSVQLSAYESLGKSSRKLAKDILSEEPFSTPLPRALDGMEIVGSGQCVFFSLIGSIH